MKAALPEADSGDWPAVGVSVSRIQPAPSMKDRAYAALKSAILNMDVYSSPGPVVLDERELSELLGVSRTPVREALAILSQEGLVKVTPRRGTVVVKKSKADIVEMIQAWAGLEGMAARLAVGHATDAEIEALSSMFTRFGPDYRPVSHIDEYSTANIAFHQALIGLSGSALLVQLTDKLMLHVRAIRHRAIFAPHRAERSLGEHLEIIEALKARQTERAERAARDHTLRLAAFVEKHVDIG